jgi:predicted nucleic acid-binding protein
MTRVFDATPLIYLGRADSLDALASLRRPLLVPERVHEEVVEQGTEKGYPDAKRVDRFVRTGRLERRRVDATERLDRLAEETRLSPADAAVLLLADEVDGTAVMDEQYGRNVADAEGVDTRGTAYLLLALVERGDLASEDARDVIDAMVDSGWHCSTDLYAKLLRKLDSLSNE